MESCRRNAPKEKDAKVNTIANCQECSGLLGIFPSPFSPDFVGDFEFFQRGAYVRFFHYTPARTSRVLTDEFARYQYQKFGSASVILTAPPLSF